MKRDPSARTVFLKFGVWTILVATAGLPAALPCPCPAPATPPPPDTVRILLLGDSTVIGSVCRKVSPKADHLEDVIRKRLAAEKDVPAVEVVNQGHDGEYIEALLQSRYDREVKPLGRFQVVLIRFGINDRAKREDFFENFPKDYQTLIARLKADNPDVRLILETTIPFGSPKREDEINGLVRKVAEVEKLPVLETHEKYAKALVFDGPNALNYRRVKVAEIPEPLRPLLPPESLSVTKGEVIVMDNLLDAEFRDLPRWFGDRHPNPAGYHVLGRSAAEYLAPILRKK